jgi:hypothetical protein
MDDTLATALVSVRSTYRGKDGTVTLARAHEVARAAGVSFDSKEPLPTSLELFLAAVAADVLGAFGRLANHRRLPLDETEAVLKATLADPLAYLDVVGAPGTPRLVALHLKVHVGTPAPHADVRAAWDDALHKSPLLNTLRPATSLTLDLAFTD